MVDAPALNPTNGLTLKNTFVYWAVSGTAVPTDTTTLPAAWNFLGDTDASSTIDFTPPGAPTRNVVQAARNNGVTFAAGYQANTDAATLSASALEITKANLDLLLNTVRTGNYADHKGGVPDHVLVLAIGQTESGEELSVCLPYAIATVNGAIPLSVNGTDSVVKIPITFSGDIDPVLGFDFRVIGGTGDDES